MPSQGHPRAHRDRYQRAASPPVPQGRAIWPPPRAFGSSTSPAPCSSSSACRTRKRKWPSRRGRVVADEPKEPEVIKKERAEKEEDERPEKKEEKRRRSNRCGPWSAWGIPGRRYAETRHNAGFSVRQAAGPANGRLKLQKRKYRAKVAEVGAERGPAVPGPAPDLHEQERPGRPRQLMDGYQAAAGERPRRLRRPGHPPRRDPGPARRAAPEPTKACAPIVEEIGTTAFPRIRIGIGPLPPGRDAADFVLSPFQPRGARPVLDGAWPRPGRPWT